MTTHSAPTSRHGHRVDLIDRTVMRWVPALFAAWDRVDDLVAAMNGSPEAFAWVVAWRAARCWPAPGELDTITTEARDRWSARIAEAEAREVDCRNAMLAAFGQASHPLIHHTPDRRETFRPWKRSEEGQREGSIRLRSRPEELAFRVGAIEVVAYSGGRYRAGIDEQGYGGWHSLVMIGSTAARALVNIGDGGAILLQQEAVEAFEAHCR